MAALGQTWTMFSWYAYPDILREFSNSHYLQTPWLHHRPKRSPLHQSKYSIRPYAANPLHPHHHVQPTTPIKNPYDPTNTLDNIPGFHWALHEFLQSRMHESEHFCEQIDPDRSSSLPQQKLRSISFQFCDLSTAIPQSLVIIEAACLATLGGHAKVKKPMERVQGLRQEIAGKSILVKKFLAHKARKYLGQSDKLLLPALELTYVFHAIAHAPREVIARQTIPAVGGAFVKREGGLLSSGSEGGGGKASGVEKGNYTIEKLIWFAVSSVRDQLISSGHSHRQIRDSPLEVYWPLCCQFLSNILTTTINADKRLRDRTKARFESRVNSDSRLNGGPVLSDPPTLPPTVTPPVSEHHPPDVGTPLSSIVDIGGPVCREQMPFGRATFKNMPEELRCHILGFLSCNDIIRCASTCLTVYDTVKCSAELQYIVELGAQRLIEVHPRPPTVSLPECLRILRNKANMWNTFRLNALDSSRLTTLYQCNSIVHGNVFSFTSLIHVDAASAVDCKAYSTRPAQIWTTKNIVHHTYRHMVQPQDLEVIITFPIDVDTDGFKYRISFRTISTGEEHPLSHGSRVVNCRAAYSKAIVIEVAAAVLDDRLVVYVYGSNFYPCLEYWSLHVLNWQLEQCGQADDLCAINNDDALLDIRFLAKEKLIALSMDGQIHLYDIEDPSKAPQLQARFMLPVHGEDGVFDHPSIFHSAASCAGLAAPDDHWIWTTNPADRVISVTWADPSSVFIISARIFFMDIPPTWFDVTSEGGHSVPWSSWGPQNSRFFPGKSGEGPDFFGIGGSRVIWADNVADGNDSWFQLHMTDFNPFAVARSIDNVFSKPTVGFQSDVQVTTYLPFVEVIRDHVSRGSLWDIVLDEEKMAIVTKPPIESGWRMQVDIFEP